MKKFFTGRLKRLNYFGASLMLGLIYLVVGMLLAAISKNSTILLGVNGMLAVVLSIISFFFQISLTARRLHDINLSGYFALICLLPMISRIFNIDLTVINGIIVIILLLVKGTNGPNKYGEIDQKRSTFSVIFPKT